MPTVAVLAAILTPKAILMLGQAAAVEEQVLMVQLLPLVLPLAVLAVIP